MIFLAQRVTNVRRPLWLLAPTKPRELVQPVKPHLYRDRRHADVALGMDDAIGRADTQAHSR